MLSNNKTFDQKNKFNKLLKKKPNSAANKAVAKKSTVSEYLATQSWYREDKQWWEYQMTNPKKRWGWRLKSAEEQFSTRQKRKILSVFYPTLEGFVENPSDFQSRMWALYTGGSQFYEEKAQKQTALKMQSETKLHDFSKTFKSLNALLFPTQYDIVNLPCFGNVFRFTKGLTQVGIREYIEPMLRLWEYRRLRFESFKLRLVNKYGEENFRLFLKNLDGKAWEYWIVSSKFTWQGLVAFYIRKRWVLVF